MNFSLAISTVFLSSLVCMSACASDVVTINVSGTLVRAPCTLTSIKTLNANFGKMRTDQIGGMIMDLPVTLNCPANSSFNISIKASGLHQGSATLATTTKANLLYFFKWKSDGTFANVDGTTRTLTNQSGNIDLGLKAELVATTGQTEGSFSGSSVLTIDYL